MPSAISENPGPDVAVALLVPVRAAPFAMFIAESSSSHCTTTSPAFFRSFPADSRNFISSWLSSSVLSSLAGVIG